ncbi:MAG: phenylalanine--tRNA ligase subunit alpha, partial [Nitrosarchaeum sp.]
MSQVFHEIEKKIMTSLKKNPIQTPEALEKSTELSPDQIRRGIEWLKLKDLAIVNESQTIHISLGKNGLESFHKGLPERRLLDLLKNEAKKLQDLQKELGSVFGPAIGLARKNNWVDTSDDKIILKNNPSELPGEKSLKQIGENKISKNELDIN